jgi:N6-L-threonylcarbamoyladenine synthase
MRLLGVETSCDETAAAVVEDGRVILSNVISSQAEIHARYGGVVPEIASRHHIENIAPVVAKAMADAGMEYADLDAVAVTQGPGLVGCLLVGLQCAKGLAFVHGKPLVPVHHIAGHIEAPFLISAPAGGEAAHHEIPLPAIALVVSGGHTSLFEVPRRGEYILLGRTRDDAAGEAYDKVAKLLGLGYPGGPIVDKLARGANDQAVDFTIAKIKSGRPDFSFSGIKTAVLYHVRREGIAPVTDPSRVPDEIRDLLASFQRAVVTALVRRLNETAEQRRPRSLLLTGGVAANTRLREDAKRAADSLGLPLFVPPIALSTDNAAMIATAGYIAFRNGTRGSFDMNAEPHLSL